MKRSALVSKTSMAAAAILLVVAVGLAWAALRDAPPATHTSEEAAHGGEGAPEVIKGPHGGRLLEDGAFAVEVTIFERGVPPEFRVFLYDDNEPVEPESARLTIELHRFGGRVDSIAFTKKEGYLVGDREIVEPHSFDVKVMAERNGMTSHWDYPSYEGRTSMTDEAVRQSGIAIETAGPASVRTVIAVNGRIAPNEDHLAHVIPRYPGIVKQIHRRLGDRVPKGGVMAVVESNQSLQSYNVKSSLAGTVIKKDITVGEYVTEGKAIYTVADLSTVWVDFDVYPKDFESLKVGQIANLFAGEGTLNATAPVIYISPFGAENTQTTVARIELPNPDGRWRPGLFVTGEIVVDDASVPLAVKASALQTFRDWDVVFLRDGDLFEIAILELGRRDDDWVEVLSGLAPGQKYAAENSFVVKADIGKSGATHDH